MGKSALNGYRNSIQGMTLIEVLIALAIVAIALTAVIKASADNIRGTAALDNKLTAMWVGKEIMNEARVGIITLPGEDSPITKKTQMLDREWYWQAYQENTANSRIKKATVKVFQFDPEADEDQSPEVELESYVYHVQ